MTTTVVAAGAQVAMPHGVIDDRRGTWGMLLFILTEAALFLMFFFTYYYLGHVSRGPWPPEPPKLMFALVMLAVLVSSSVVLHLGERAEKEGRSGTARLFVGATVLMGIGFLVLQTLEYRKHLKTQTPMTDAYGSIFYTITSFHAAHLMLGLCMLLYVLALPQIGPGHKPPHRALHNASLYWHFVDFVWVLIVALLYLAPNIGR
jgi:heme/copper-type cytochrome/quinol oxidase subunit 3